MNYSRDDLQDRKNALVTVDRDRQIKKTFFQPKFRKCVFGSDTGDTRDTLPETIVP
jgi:hypothetical protein